MAFGQKSCSHSLGIEHHLLLVLLELGRLSLQFSRHKLPKNIFLVSVKYLFQGNGYSTDSMVMRASLQGGEDGTIHSGFQVIHDGVSSLINTFLATTEENHAGSKVYQLIG